MNRYYGDNKKVVKACLDKIRGHPTKGSFNYKAMVSYNKCLINNQLHLHACCLGNELSNTGAMSLLTREFLIQEMVKWQEFLPRKQ